MDSKALLADLQASAALARNETVQIETRHATLRRVLFARSVQSKRMDLEALNVDMAFRAFRTEEAWLLRHGSGAQEEETVAEAPPAGDRREAGGGPPRKRRKLSCWSLFVRNESSHTTGASPNFSTLGAKYRALAPEQMQALRDELADLERLDLLRESQEKPSDVRRRQQRQAIANWSSVRSSSLAASGGAPQPLADAQPRGAVEPQASASGKASNGAEFRLATVPEYVPWREIAFVKGLWRKKGRRRGKHKRRPTNRPAHGQRTSCMGKA